MIQRTWRQFKIQFDKLDLGLSKIRVTTFFILLLPIMVYAQNNEKVLYSFCSLPDCTDGSYPESGVIQDKVGNLYGTTDAGGAGAGTIFSLTRHSGLEELRTIYTFAGGDDGLGPTGLTLGSEDNFYGTTLYGGGSLNCSDGGCGTVFQLVLKDGAWTKNLLYAFKGGADGSIPMAGVVVDKAGNLYGTTWEGGDFGVGTVFELIHSGNDWKEIVLHSFDGSDGSSPISGLTLDTSGNIYGTTSLGGTDNAGIVFELMRRSKGYEETVLHSFRLNGTDGVGPYAGSLVLDADGNLYGTTSAGGTVNSGTVFELVRPKSGALKEKILYSFQGGEDGSAPYTGVILDGTGNIYGTTSIDGSGGDGTVFALTNIKGTWTKKVLTSFNGENGSEPFGNLVLGSNGNIYGTAALGSLNGTGNVFEVRH